MPNNSSTEIVVAGANRGAEDRHLPRVLSRDRVAHFQRRFLEDHQPVGPTEIAIVGDLARQAAAMERWGVASEAVERHAASTLPTFDSPILPDAPSIDALLAGAMSTEAADRCERQALGHSRAFYRALNTLEQRKALRQTSDETRGPKLIPALSRRSGVRKVPGGPLPPRSTPVPPLRRNPRLLHGGAEVQGMQRLQTAGRAAIGHRHGPLAARLEHLV